MNKSLLLSPLFFMLSLGGLFAQQTVVINVGEVVVNPLETTSVCVPVTVDVFDSIATLQFDIIWDSSVISYTNVDLGDDPLTISANDYNLVEPGRWRLVWSEGQLSGITLDPGTELFSLCYSFPAGQGGSTDVQIDTAGTVVFAMSDVVPLPYTANPGSVTLSTGTSATNVPAWASEVVIFPNPVAEEQIQLQGNYPALDGVAIYNIQGQLIRAYAPNLSTIPLDGLAPGQYILRLQSGVEQANFKLLKQ